MLRSIAPKVKSISSSYFQLSTEGEERKKMGPQIILVLIVALCTTTFSAEAETSCSDTVTFSELIEVSYDTALHFIQRGIPSHVVSGLYELGFQEITSNVSCLCPGRDDFGISVGCASSVFLGEEEKFMMRTLAKSIEEDALRKKKYFPFFHDNKNEEMPDFSSDAASIAGEMLEKTREYILARAEYLVSNAMGVRVVSRTAVPILTPIGVKFPADELLMYDPKAATVCRKGKLVGTAIERSIPGPAYIAYSIAVVIHAELAKASVDSAKQLYNKAVGLAAKAARCQRKGGNSVKIPEQYFDELVQGGESVMSTAVLSYEEVSMGEWWFHRLGDFQNNMIVPFALFRNDLRQLSSLSGYRKKFTVNVVDSGDIDGMGLSHEMRVKVEKKSIMREIKGIDLEGFRRAFMSYPPPSSGRQPVICRDTWAIFSRLVPVTDSRECCCPSQCGNFGETSLVFSMETEMCCTACNLLDCPGGDGSDPKSGASNVVLTPRSEPMQMVLI